MAGKIRVKVEMSNTGCPAEIETILGRKIGSSISKVAFPAASGRVDGRLRRANQIVTKKGGAIDCNEGTGGGVGVGILHCPTRRALVVCQRRTCVFGEAIAMPSRR